MSHRRSFGLANFCGDIAQEQLTQGIGTLRNTQTRAENITVFEAAIKKDAHSFQFIVQITLFQLFLMFNKRNFEYKFKNTSIQFY